MFVLLFLLLLPILSCSKNVSFYVYLRGLAILSHGVWKIELTNSSQNAKNNWSIHRPTPFRRIKITIWNQLHVENYQFVKMPNCRKKRLGQFLLSHARKACEGLQKNTTQHTDMWQNAPKKEATPSLLFVLEDWSCKRRYNKNVIKILLLKYSISS